MYGKKRKVCFSYSLAIFFKLLNWKQLLKVLSNSLDLKPHPEYRNIYRNVRIQSTSNDNKLVFHLLTEYKHHVAEQRKKEIQMENDGTANENTKKY